jgi:hypothetical protein
MKQIYTKEQQTSPKQIFAVPLVVFEAACSLKIIEPNYENAGISCAETKEPPTRSLKLHPLLLWAEHTRMMYIPPSPHCASAISAPAALFRTRQFAFPSSSLSHSARQFIHLTVQPPAKYNNHSRFDRANFWAVCSRVKDKPAPAMGKVSTARRGTEWREHAAVTNSLGAHPRRLPCSFCLPTHWLTDWLDFMRAQKFITSAGSYFAHIATRRKENIKRTFF